jgi:oligopeptide/dipeptide ABC transporter ATP-binding protein
VSDTQKVLQVTDLWTQFDTQDGMVHAVNGVSFDLNKGEFLGIVGESGPGKSVLMMSLLRLIPLPPGEIVAGEAIFEDQDLLTLDIDELKKVRGGRIGFIFALACDPQLLIADEPTTALDVTIQAQIIEIVRDLRDELGTAVIWITHDLGVVASLVDRVVVMYGGEIVEEAPVGKLYGKPQHPYTVGLLGSLPRLDQKHQELVSIKGQPASLYAKPTSCTFAPRCKYAYDLCRTENPELTKISDTHAVACWWDIDNNRPRYGR